MTAEILFRRFGVASVSIQESGTHHQDRTGAGRANAVEALPLRYLHLLTVLAGFQEWLSLNRSERWPFAVERRLDRV